MGKARFLLSGLVRTELHQAEIGILFSEKEKRNILATPNRSGFLIKNKGYFNFVSNYSIEENGL